MTSEPASKKPLQPSRISPLARRLVILTVAFSTLVALMTTAIQLYVDYRRELGQIELTFQQIDHAHLPTIASALWATNQKELQIALDGLSRLPDVRFVKVTEKEKVWAESGVDKVRGIRSRDYQLTYKHRDRLEAIGDLHVVIDLDGIYQRLLDKFWVILITNGVKTFLVSGFMLWLFHWLITRHLRKIAGYAARLGIKNLEDKLQLSRKESSKPDEFDMVLDGLDRMQFNLKEALHALELDINQRKQVEAALRQSEDLLAKSQEIARIGSFRYDVITQHMTCSSEFYKILDLQPEEFDGSYKSFMDAIHPDDRENVNKIYSDSLSINADSCQSEHRLICRHSGMIRYIHQKCVHLRDANGSVTTSIGMLQDISERKQAEEQLKLSASVFKYSHQGIMITNSNGEIVDVNPAFSDMTGYTREEAIGANPRILQSGRHDSAWYKSMWQTLRSKGHWRGEIWNRRKNGEIFPELEDISAVHNDAGEAINYVAVFSDITQQKQHEDELDRIAHYDLLTGLPNRRLLIDHLNQALQLAKHDGKLLAIAYVDLDGFKPINDRYGHALGDRLLVEVSHRLRDALNEGDTLARLGGDEFIILLSDLEHVDACLQSLDRALDAVKAPVVVDDIPLDITASIGVTLYPLDDANGDTLLRHADRAMYTAKQAGKNCYHLFDPDLDREQQDYQEQMQRLSAALYNNEFVLYQQPKVNLLTGELVGCEALIRWQHPEQGLLPPSAFLGMFSNHPLEIELGVWVIETALKQIESWSRQGIDIITSVNISAHHLLHPSFVSQLAGLLEKYPTVQANMLELEVLETAAMSDLDRAIDVMSQCKGLGVHLSLDDFGTGYSSLAYFRRFPVDTLKIDKSFVHDMTVDHEGMAMVESVIRLAELFDRSTIAEGVETKEQVNVLIKLGCHLAQGYFIARPMPADNIEGWLADWRKQATWQQLGIQNKDKQVSVAKDDKPAK